MLGGIILHPEYLSETKKMISIGFLLQKWSMWFNSKQHEEPYQFLTSQ
ncbi:hypothetical protein STRCR_0222 [Streptococcus criceti HS-6]|uniref:Uncharacterized protein n=1 Tax=Streptococcus criceti HS-6 TaxID=873449 RepID=G5JNR0_STRCG|nr:hypothetical protein STRCR_0222 [Streptococcus criceti HS-6]